MYDSRISSSMSTPVGTRGIIFSFSVAMLLFYLSAYCLAPSFPNVFVGNPPAGCPLIRLGRTGMTRDVDRDYFFVELGHIRILSAVLVWWVLFA